MRDTNAPAARRGRHVDAGRRLRSRVRTGLRGAAAWAAVPALAAAGVLLSAGTGSDALAGSAPVGAAESITGPTAHLAGPTAQMPAPTTVPARGAPDGGPATEPAVPSPAGTVGAPGAADGEPGERATEGAPPPAPPVPAIAVRDASLTAVTAGLRDATPPPTRLVIPSVGIDMPVGPVGVRDDGQMSVPDDVDAVGWYRYGPAPGDPSGTSVLASHVDSWEKGVGPFARLRHEVTPGTLVLVTSADGTTRRYEVADNRMIAKPELPVDLLFDRGGPPRLVLVTCGGRFLRDIGRYTDNIVVTAVPVEA